MNLDRGNESDADAAALPTARDTQTLPRDINEQVRALAERARQLAAEQAARGESGLGDAAANASSTPGVASTPASSSSSSLGAGTSGPSSSSPGVSAASSSSLGAAARNPSSSSLGAAERSASSCSLGAAGRNPAASGLGKPARDPSASGLGNAAARASSEPAPNATSSPATQASEEPTGLDALAALAAAAEDASDAARPAEDAPASGRPKSASGSLPVAEEKPWRIRAEGEMVYDFIDTSATRRWMSSRGTLDELECSSDGGKTWMLVVDEPAFADVRAGGLRSRTTTGSMRVVTSVEEVESVRTQRQTGSVPAVGAPARAAQPTSSSASSSEPRASRNTEAAESYEPIAGRKILLILTLLLSIAVAAVYFRPQEELPYGIRIPESPAGQRLSWVMGQITGGSARLTAADLPAQFSDDAIGRATPERLLTTLAYFDDWAPSYTILRWLERPTDHRIVGLLETPRGHRGIVEIQTDPTPPYKIRGMLFREAR